MKLYYLPIASLIFTLSASAEAQCAYSAYVDFGPAMTNGNLDQKELTYRSSGIIKNDRTPDVTKNYFASYSSYRQTKTGEFELINIGPYDSESILYTELQKQISNLESQGYKKKTNSHSFPAVIVINKRPC